MSNRSPKRSLLTERKVRSVIREEINTRYGNNLTARQKAMLEEGILDAMKGLFGGVKSAAGAVGGAALKLAGKANQAIGNASADMFQALKAAAEPVTKQLQAAGADIAKAFAAGKIPAITAAINKMKDDLEAAEEQLKELQKNSGEKPAGAKPAAAAAGTPAAVAPAAGTLAAAAPAAGTLAEAMEESLRRKYSLGLISLNEYNIKRRR